MFLVVLELFNIVRVNLMKLFTVLYEYGNDAMTRTQTYEVVFRFSDIWIIDSEFRLVDVKRSLIVLLDLVPTRYKM